MPSIRFDICPGSDCKTLRFTDMTGRVPDAPDGYGASAVLSSYSGMLTIRDYLGNVVMPDIEVSPATDNVAEVIDLMDGELYPDGATIGLPDGIYEVIYQVRDETTNLIVGEARKNMAITCAFSCDLATAISKSPCGCCDDDTDAMIIRARDYRNMSFAMANTGEIRKAGTLFLSAQETLSGALCNCQ